jgi:hypothetical protein
MNTKYPYEEFENSKLWTVIEEALNKLIDNKDLIEQTQKKYIVGYLCKQVLLTYPELK